jgi:hypothetical protein
MILLLLTLTDTMQELPEPAPSAQPEPGIYEDGTQPLATSFSAGSLTSPCYTNPYNMPTCGAGAPSSTEQLPEPAASAQPAPTSPPTGAQSLDSGLAACSISCPSARGPLTTQPQLGRLDNGTGPSAASLYAGSTTPAASPIAGSTTSACYTNLWSMLTCGLNNVIAHGAHSSAGAGQKLGPPGVVMGSGNAANSGNPYNVRSHGAHSSGSVAQNPGPPTGQLQVVTAPTRSAQPCSSLGQEPGPPAAQLQKITAPTRDAQPEPGSSGDRTQPAAESFSAHSLNPPPCCTNRCNVVASNGDPSSSIGQHLSPPAEAQGAGNATNSDKMLWAQQAVKGEGQEVGSLKWPLEDTDQLHRLRRGMQHWVSKPQVRWIGGLSPTSIDHAW